MPKRLLYYRLRILLAVSLIWLVFGVVFYFNLFPANDLGVRVSPLQFDVTFGIVGLFINAVLIFYLKPAFNELPLWLSSLIKMGVTLLLFVLIAFVLLLIYYVFLYNGSFPRFLQSFFTKIVYTQTFGIFLVDMAVVTLISIIHLEVIDKYGPGMFWSMLIGEYHKPVIQKRLFVFLDINESTAIAEELGNERYFRMLRRFYRDITLPVMANDGEIYQYVGDEIVLTWPDTAENKIKCLKFIRNTYFLIERLSKRYEKVYGKVPQFKVGVHAGYVTAGFIGVIKRELIYCGDTLNTTARIRSLCSELNETFLLSDDFVRDFPQPYGYVIEPVGETELKGKQEPMKLYSLKFE